MHKWLKEKKPIPVIVKDFFAVNVGKGWQAVYQCPNLGVRLLRDAQGLIRAFPTKERAEIAAARALNHAENVGRTPIAVTREIRVGVRKTRARTS